MISFALALACSSSIWSTAVIGADDRQKAGKFVEKEALGQLLLSLGSGMPWRRAGGRPRVKTASLVDSASQHVVSEKLDAPSLSLKPRSVVSNALSAISQGKFWSWMKFLDPKAENKELSAPKTWNSNPKYSFLNGCAAIDIVSEFRRSPDHYSFRVTVKRRAMSGFFGMHGSVQSRDYIVDVTKGSCFEVGQTVMNALDYDIGMIIGRESACSMDEAWIEEHGIDDLPRGRDQPFYTVLPDSRSEIGSNIRYLAEDVLIKAKMEHLFQNPMLDLFLRKDDDERREEDEESQSSEEGPGDTAGCWLVHDVKPWD
jgi:hemimethylated DNA binding protein